MTLLEWLAGDPEVTLSTCREDGIDAAVEYELSLMEDEQPELFAEVTHGAVRTELVRMLDAAGKG